VSRAAARTPARLPACLPACLPASAPAAGSGRGSAHPRPLCARPAVASRLFWGVRSLFPPRFAPSSHPGALPRYLAALLLCLSAMLHLELPHVNVLSKVDLLRHYGRLGAPPGRARPRRAAPRRLLGGRSAPRRPPAPPAPTARCPCHPTAPSPSRPPDFSLSFYTEVQDLSYLVRAMRRDRFGAKHRWGGGCQGRAG
jgi:hypothetical protein